MISEQREDDIHYVCSLLEYISRKTNNYIGDIVVLFDDSDLAWQLEFAHISASMTFEQAAERVTNHLSIARGKFACQYDRPSHVDIGDIYKTLVIHYMANNNISAPEAIKKALNSGFSKFITEYRF